MPKIFYCLFIGCCLAANSFSAIKKTDFTDLSQVCFMNNTKNFSFYTPHTTTIFIVNDGSPSIDFIYELQKQRDHSNYSNTQNIVEFDPNSPAIKINNDAYSPSKHDLKRIITCDFIGSMGMHGGTYIQNILSKHYGIDLELIADKKTNALLESKTNTQEAINRLYAKYAKDQKMMGYMDKFLIKGGLIDNESTLIAALKNNQSKGIVFKTPKGCQGAGVIVVPPKDIQSILKGYDAKLSPTEYLKPIKYHQKVYDHLVNNKQLAWQTRIPPEDYHAERGLQFNLNKTITPFFTTYSVVVPPFELIDHYGNESLASLFTNLTPEEKSYFDRILHELLDEKAKLGGEGITGIFDKKIQLRSFDSSAFIMKNKGKTYPKIYEFNTRLSATASLMEAAQHDIKSKIGNNQGHIWPMTPFIPLPDNIPPSELAHILIEVLEEFRVMNPNYHIDIGRAQQSHNLSSIRVYLHVRPAPQIQDVFWQRESWRFSQMLYNEVNRYMKENYVKPSDLQPTDLAQKATE